MFTGIVEEKGKVRYIQLTGESGILAVKARKVLEGKWWQHPLRCFPRVRVQKRPLQQLFSNSYKVPLYFPHIYFLLYTKKRFAKTGKILIYHSCFYFKYCLKF